MSLRTLFRPRLPIVMAASAILACSVHAQPVDAGHNVENMVEQLQGKPRTRSLGRNLVVESAPEQARPSLSLLIQFDFASAGVRAESVPVLEDLSRALRTPQLAGSRFAIEGHTDAKGSDEYNMYLSQRRAQAVRDVLVRHGVEAERLQVKGLGSSEPANAADPQAAENRRVRIVNLD